VEDKNRQPKNNERRERFKVVFRPNISFDRLAQIVLMVVRRKIKWKHCAELSVQRLPSRWMAASQVAMCHRFRLRILLLIVGDAVRECPLPRWYPESIPVN
jgi:hypothetical protein